MVQSNRLDRARGSLLGLAIGDALGAPLEGLSPQQIRAHYGQVVDYVDGVIAWKKKPYRWRMPGLYSDDTQQALVLAEVLLTCGRIDPERVAALYLDLATPPGSFVGAHRGVGRSFRHVLEALRRGHAPCLDGRCSAGIGAAMRIAPVALFYSEASGSTLNYCGRGSKMFRAALAASLMTHRDCRSLAGALAVACAVRYFAEGGERKPSFLFLLAGEVARAERRMAQEFAAQVTSLSEHAHSLSRAIAHVESLLELPRERALALLIDEANRHGADPVCRRATMGFPPACIPTCLYLLMTTDSFEEAITEVVNLGGDADTAGAILGAMAGAHYGPDAIPQHWLKGLKNREGVERRGEALARRSTAGLAIPDLVETERWLSACEGASREGHLLQRQSGGDLGANRRI